MRKAVNVIRVNFVCYSMYKLGGVFINAKRNT